MSARKSTAQKNNRNLFFLSFKSFIWLTIQIKLLQKRHYQQRMTIKSYSHEWVSDAIFQTDGDILFSCADCALLSNTCKLWQFFPDYMIGFAPRTPLKTYQNGNKQSINAQSPFTQCDYSMLFVTFCLFMHRKYYKLYSDSLQMTEVSKSEYHSLERSKQFGFAPLHCTANNVWLIWEGTHSFAKYYNHGWQSAVIRIQ